MEPPPLLLTHDAAPILSKVALWLTALQGIGYSSILSTTCFSHYQEGDHCHMKCFTCIDTLYVLITVRSRYIYFTWLILMQPARQEKCKSFDLQGITKFSNAKIWQNHWDFLYGVMYETWNEKPILFSLYLSPISPRRYIFYFVSHQSNCFDRYFKKHWVSQIIRVFTTSKSDRNIKQFLRIITI